MTQQRVFFYGSFISLEVLAEHGFTPQRVETARLDGFDISIAPLATLVEQPGASVYGIVASADAASVERLYEEGWVQAYRPIEVMVSTAAGEVLTASCYIAPPGAPAPPDPGYLQRIVDAARQHHFPTEYVDRLRSLTG